MSSALDQARSARSVLIVRLSALGDCIHALPAIQALRAARPDVRIGWVVDDRFSPLFEGHPDVDELHVLPRRGLASKTWLARASALRGLAGRLREKRFDAVVDTQGLAKSAFVALASGAPLRVGLSAEAGARELSWATYNLRPEVPAGTKHVSERARALLVPFGVSADAALPHPKLPVRPDAAAKVDSWLGAMGLLGKRFAALNPGAGWETKLWPPESFGALAAMVRRDLGLESLVTWFGAAEKALAGRVVAASGGAARMAEPTNLQELSALLVRAALYVGSDTGPTHLAAAAGAPTVALFGPADAVRNRPLGPAVETVTAGRDCAPCWRRSGCPRGLECMKGISPEAVLAAAVRVSAGGAGR